MEKVKILQVSADYGVANEIFEKELNKALEDGWKLSGDMVVTFVNLPVYPQLTYSQRLVKEIEK